MLIQEARWLADSLSTYSTDRLSPLLNVGSSTLEYRARIQPHVESLVFEPLSRRGVETTHLDLKRGAGVDVSGDILDPEVFEGLRRKGYNAILCTNILEHVADPQRVLARCADLLPEEGLLFVTAPRSYPYHPDPIDNGYRPSPDELAAALPALCLRAGAVVDGRTFFHYVLTERPVEALHLLRILLPFLSLDKWKASVSRLCWSFKPFQASCVVLQKRPSPGER